MRIADAYDRFMRVFYWPCQINMGAALGIIPLAILIPEVARYALKPFMWLSVGLTTTFFVFSLVDGRYTRASLAASTMNIEKKFDIEKHVEPQLLFFRNAGFGLWILIMGFAAITNFSPKAKIFIAYGISAFGGIVLQTMHSLKYNTQVATEALKYGNETIPVSPPKTTTADKLGWLLIMTIILTTAAFVANVYFGVELI